VPWNKGRTYIIAKRATYATKSSWMKAVRRWHGDTCMRCGWAETACDAHHLVAKGNGGMNTLDNAIVLCPNCHRLAHTRPDVQASLASIKSAAVPIAEAR
jgi:5-methylcytosine-specific restriction endonuclease McrA